MEVLGVRVDNLEKEEILAKIESFFDEEKFHQIATVNPEFILEAQKNEQFRKILNNCELNVADGFGLNFAFLKNGQKLKCRLAGADLASEILKMAEKKKLCVFLAINKDGLSSFEEIKTALLKTYPELIITGADLNPNVNGQMSHVTCNCIVLCNFGAPFQEIFIDSVKNDTIRLAMGVGGTFDFVTGKAKRAPFFMRKIGLEWFWRLLRQPKRITRIFNAVIVFPIKLMLSRNV